MNEKLLLLQVKESVYNQIFEFFLIPSLKVKSVALVCGMVLLSTMSFAQLPSEFSGNLRLWVDGDDPANNNTQPASGANVTLWSDKSPYSSNLASTGTHPTYVPADPAFNNMGVLDFGTSSVLHNGSFTPWSGDHTFFIVFQQQTTLSGGRGLFSSGDDGGNNTAEETRFEVSLEAAGTNFVHHTNSSGGTTGTADNSLFGTQAAAIAAPKIYCFTRLGNNVTCYTGGLQVSTNVTTTGNTFDDYYLNSNRELDMRNDCKIAEVIIYDTVLSPDALAKINNYLACKYGLPVATSTPGGIDPCNVALWMKGDAGTDTTGLNLNSWFDQGVNNFNGSANSGQEPLFNPKVNNYNSSLTFNPANLDKLDLEAATANDGLMMGTNGFSIYTVASVDTVTTTGGVLFADHLCGSTPETPGYNLRFDSALKKWTFYGSGTNLTNNATVQVKHSNTNYALLSLSRSGQTYILNTNEGVADTAASTTPINYASTGPFSERWIGASESTCALNTLDGSLSELIVVSDAVSATQDKQIRSYLALKYGLTLPSSLTNYLASDGLTAIWNNAGHWNDVAGIGRDDDSGLDQRISKSQHKSAVVTMATNNDFANPNIHPSRTAFGTDLSFLAWGNNNIPAINGWTITGAPTNFAILPERWRVKNTGSVGPVTIRVETENVNNPFPTFVDSLFLVHHASTLSSATPVAMSETFPGSGIWVLDGVNFGANDFFSFAVKNKLIVEFSSSAMASGDEASATPFPTVIATGTINLPTSFEIIDNPISATVTLDYAYVNDVINISQGIYDDSIFLLSGMSLVDDNDDEGTEIVQFQFSFTSSVGVISGNANGIGGPTPTCNYTITDDDSYTVAIIVPSGGNTTEGPTSSVRFRVYVEGGPNLTGSPITGTLSLSGTATSGADYTALPVGPMHFTIPNGDDDDTVVVVVTNDLFLELTETVIGTISGVTSGISITPTPATANIVDDELANVQVVVGSPVNAAEGSSLSYTISLAGGVSNRTGGPVTGAITYGGVAISGSDYVPNPNSFTINNLGSSTTISVFAIDDQVVELSETVTASTSTIVINGVSYSSPSSATANILDQDNIGLTISLTSSVNGVLENVGTLTYTVALDGSLVNGTGSAITGTVDLITGSTASSIADFGNVTSFSIPNGASSAPITVSIVDDGLIETTETIVATISNPLPFGTPSATNNGVSVNIFDNDAGGLQISIGSPTDATEAFPTGSANVTFTVSIVSGTAAASDITGTIDYSASQALNGSDFDATGQTSYLIPAGSLSTPITLPVIDDGFSEPDEDVIATLTGSPSLVGATYVNTSSTATIFDDDAANLTIIIDTILGGNGTEGGSPVYFVVGLDLGDINGTGNPITGNLALGGTAGSGDYSFTPPLTYSIPNGATSDTVIIAVTDDFNVEFTEMLTATVLNTNVGSVSTTNNTATAFIYDNDLPTLSLSALSPTNGEEGVNDITFTVTLDNGLINNLGQDITGTIIYSGTAVSGSDFTEIANFTIPDGQEFETHTLTVTNDLVIENLETVTATLTNPSFGVMSVDSVVTADVIDNDLADAQITIANTVDGVEAPAPTDAEFVVSVVNSLGSNLENQTGMPITGNFAIAGTAQGGGVDYSYTGTNTFTIPDNSFSDVIVISILDDNIEELTETIIVSLISTSLGNVSTDSVATALILDDDTDSDHDGLPDIYDSDDVNIDTDCDGIFDGCDYDPNGDGSYLNGNDVDGDGINDACDADNNNDGIIDNGPDIVGANNFPDGFNDLVWVPTDNDGDLLPDHVDPNDNNIDTDGDGITDGADVDVDGDGILDNGCDSDGDRIRDPADSDVDNLNGLDPGSIDNDGDGIVARWDMNDIQYDGQQINYIVSPNGDGVNETLIIQGVQVIERHVLTIYNRYGQPIYIDQEYDNMWNGEVNQDSVLGTEKVLDGVYYYTLDVGEEGAPVRGYIEIRY